MMLNRTTLDEFCEAPEMYARTAIAGTRWQITTESGNAVLLEETEYVAMAEALKIVCQHPEWTK